MKKALMIVDMQIMPFIWKDYGGKALYQEKELLQKTQQLISKARAAHASIYYVMYTETGDSLRVENGQLWQVHPEILPQANDKLIVKYHADSFFETDLDTMLKADGIDSIVICGVQSEFCIDTTVRRAHSLGYKVELAADAHSTFDSDVLSAVQVISHHNATLTQFADIFPTESIAFQ